MADTPSNIVMRQAKVDYGVTTAYGDEIGIVKDVKIKISPAVTENDSYGRTIVPGYKIEGQFRALETDATSLNNLFTIISDRTPMYYRFTEKTIANSFKTNKKINIYPDTEIDMNGKADGILCKFAFYTPSGSLDNLLGA